LAIERRFSPMAEKKLKKRLKLTDEQWNKLEKLLPKPRVSKKGGSSWADNRSVFEGILWILRTGAPWQDLPSEYPSPSTCWRRLRPWEEQDVWVTAWRAFLSELDEKEQLDWSESFVDGSFAPAKKGALSSAKPRGGRARSGWWWLTAKEFLWGTTWTLRPRTRLRSSRRR